MEAEVREILRNAAKEESRPATGLGSRIAARFRDTGLKSDLPEFRGHHPQPAELAS
jgi:plasmid stability protein